LLKVRNKKFSLIMAIVFALTMVFPFAAFANTPEVLSTPNVNDGQATSLGTVFFNFTAGQLQDGDSVTMSLPKDFEFRNAKGEVMTDTDWSSVTSGVYGQTGGNYFKIPAKYLDNTNAFGAGTGLDIQMIDSNSIKVTVNGNLDASQNAYLYLYLGNVYVDSGFDGDINLSVKAPSNSGFTSGDMTVGRVSGGTVSLEATDAPTFSNSDQATIRVEEDVPGAFDASKESLKFTLPDGFCWDSVDSVTLFWGKESNASTGDLATYLKGKFNIKDDKLTLDLPSNFESSEAIAFEVKATIECDDETSAKLGDVIAKVDGESSFDQSELVVGHYGQYDTSITTGDPTTVVAGQLEQKIADINVNESIKGSLIDGRTVTLTLPSNFKWNKIDTDTDHNTGLSFEGFPGKDGKTAKWQVNGESTDAAALSLSGMEVAVEPGTTGDLVVEVGGTAGLSGELTVATVQQPVTITSSATPVLSIGKANQPIGDLTVTENVAGALLADKNLNLVLPTGFKWSKYSDISVTSGDLKIDNGGITTADSDATLVIPIDNDSTEASTITLTNLAVTVDRTAPEGDVAVKVKGDSPNQVNDASEVQDSYGLLNGSYLEVDSLPCFTVNSDYKVFPETGTAAKTLCATIGTPAPSESNLATTVTLGDNGSYISNGRIMVQLRDAANALGVTAQNIFWDNATKTATFIKGDRVAQVTIGVKQVKLNGVSLPTDMGAEIKDGHTFVSLSQAGIALGATATWDNTTKTATLK